MWNLPARGTQSESESDSTFLGVANTLLSPLAFSQRKGQPDALEEIQRPTREELEAVVVKDDVDFAAASGPVHSEASSRSCGIDRTWAINIVLVV